MWYISGFTTLALSDFDTLDNLVQDGLEIDAQWMKFLFQIFFRSTRRAIVPTYKSLIVFDRIILIDAFTQMHAENTWMRAVNFINSFSCKYVLMCKQWKIGGNSEKAVLFGNCFRDETMFYTYSAGDAQECQL